MKPLLFEIFIDDISADGLEIDAQAPGTPWLEQVMRDALGAGFVAGGRARLELTLQRAEQDVDVRGRLRYDARPTCDRCLEPFSRSAEVSIALHLSPLYENRRQRELEERQEVALVRDDLEFSYYEGDRFDLMELVREQVILSLPMTNVPEQDPSGNCRSCGRNVAELLRSTGSGGDRRWDALRALRSKFPPKG